MATSQDDFEAAEVAVTLTVKEWATISALLISTGNDKALPLFSSISAQVLEGTEHLA